MIALTDEKEQNKMRSDPLYMLEHGEKAKVKVSFIQESGRCRLKDFTQARCEWSVFNQGPISPLDLMN